MDDPYLYNLCEEIDATVFSGDQLYNQTNLLGFKKYLARWNREVDTIVKAFAKENKEDKL